jgi:hypothetical protein
MQAKESVVRATVVLLLWLLLTACIKSNVDSKRVMVDANAKPLQSLLVFVESATLGSAKEVEAVVAKELRTRGVVVQPGLDHLAHDATINDIFARSEALGVDGILIVALEGTGIETNRDPVPVGNYRPKSTSAWVGHYSARLYDVRIKGKRTKVWQAKVNSRAGGVGTLLEFSTINDVTDHAAREIVDELANDDMIAGSQQGLRP